MTAAKAERRARYKRRRRLRYRVRRWRARHSTCDWTATDCPLAAPGARRRRPGA